MNVKENIEIVYKIWMAHLFNFQWATVSGGFINGFPVALLERLDWHLRMRLMEN